MSFVTTVPIFDWPSAVSPWKQAFRAGGAAQDSGFTLGGSAILTPEAGGRAWLDAQFSYTGGIKGRLVSWLLSKIMNGNVFRVPVARSAQLVSALDLGLPFTYDQFGNPWSNGLPWGSRFNWQFEPCIVATADASEGSTTVSVDLGSTTVSVDLGVIGQVLNFGHPVGHLGRCYVIDDIAYGAGTLATLTLNPPLRVDVTAGDLFTLRPSMLATVPDPTGFQALFEPGGVIQPGTISFREALL